MSRLESWLLDRGPSAWRYVLRMGVTALLPSVAIGAVLSIALHLAGVPADKMEPKFPGTPIVAFLSVVIVSPVLETVIMSAGIAVFLLFTKRPFVIAGLSAALWAVLHSAAYPVWGFVIAWPFFVF